MLASAGPLSAMIPEPTREAPLKDPFEETNKNKNEQTIADPLEPINRNMFVFNSFYYFYLLKPAARGYQAATTSNTRIHVRNFYRNLNEPVTIVNALLQGEADDAGTASKRFIINSIFGLGGLFDPARHHHRRVFRGFDQTLARWGAGHGIYILWPLVGPSSVRGTGAHLLDESMDPFYWSPHIEVTAAGLTLDTVSWTAMEGQHYEDILLHSVDPYSSLKNIYEQTTHDKARN